jgi:integrase/recombinase XerD
VSLHKEAEERLEAWLGAAGICGDTSGPLFRPVKTARGGGRTGFASRPMTRRAVQKLIEGHFRQLKVDPNVTVHSLRVTALTTARERSQHHRLAGFCGTCRSADDAEIYKES